MESWSRSSWRRTPRSRSKQNTVEWARLLPAGARRGDGRQGPGRRRHAPRPAGHQRRPQGDRPGRRPRRGARARRGGLQPGGVEGRASTRTSATASRSTCTPWRCTTTPTHFEKAGVSASRRPTRRRSRRRWTSSRAAGIATAVLDADPVAGHLMFLSLLWQNGGEPYAEDGSKATFDSEAGHRRADLDGRPDQEGLQPQERRPGHAVRRASRTARSRSPGTASGRSTTSRRAKVPFGIAPIPTIGDAAGRVGELAQLLHHAGRRTEDDNKLARGQGVHRLDERAVGRVGRRRHDPGPQVRPRERRRAPTTTAGADRRADRQHAVPAAGARVWVTCRRRPWRSRSTEAMLGKRSPADALKDAAAKATSCHGGEPEEVRRLTMATTATPAHRRRPRGEATSSPRPAAAARRRTRRDSPWTPWLFLAPYLAAVPGASWSRRSSTASGSACTTTTTRCPGKPFVGLDNYADLFDSSR